MANVIFTHAALGEYQAAVDWYQQRDPDAALRFVAEVARVTAQIAAQPNRYSWYDDEFREAVLLRHPYSVVYRVEPSGDVLVIAIAHNRREPGYWQDRT